MTTPINWQEKTVNGNKCYTAYGPEGTIRSITDELEVGKGANLPLASGNTASGVISFVSEVYSTGYKVKIGNVYGGYEKAVLVKLVS